MAAAEVRFHEKCAAGTVLSRFDSPKSYLSKSKGLFKAKFARKAQLIHDYEKIPRKVPRKSEETFRDQAWESARKSKPLSSRFE